MNCTSCSGDGLVPFFTSAILFRPPFEFIKIYIGQLPLDTEQPALRNILEPLASLKQVKIIKGDHTRGKFDLFCYAFVTMRGNEHFANQIISHLQKDHPSWKMNVKHDHDRKRNPKPYPNPNLGYAPPGPMPYQGYLPVHPYPHYPPQHLQPQTNQKIIGLKPCNILVRELWIGGIPDNLDKAYLSQLMAYYGIIEDIETFPKFAFVKYKQVCEATTAYERAEEIFQRLGTPPGFRIVFSDPSRRAFVVSNNYEFERQSTHVPIVFLGFPPVTSATVEMEVIKPVVEKIATPTAEYMRKNVNSQNRSYFLFSFQSVHIAIKVKQELSKRRDLLGDKRAEVAVLLEEASILKNRDLSRTQQLFGSDYSHDKNRRPPPYMGADPNMKGMMMNPMSYPIYPNRMMPPNHFVNPYYPHPYMYEQPFYKPEQGNGHFQPQHHPAPKPEAKENIHDILKDVMKASEGEKKPEKSQEGREEDILSKLLGSEANLAREQKEEEGEYKKEEREPSWSGFLMWKAMKRVGVDGHSKKVEPEDYSINIVFLIDLEDIALLEKNVMTLEASSNIGRETFKEYIPHLKSKAGVAVSKDFIMYVMSKSEFSDEIEVIGEEELLVVLEKASSLALVRDKLIKNEELP